MPEATLGGDAQEKKPAVAPVPPPSSKKAAKTNGKAPAAAKEPGQAKEPEVLPPQEPAKIPTVVDRAAVALAVGGVEDQLIEWWPMLEQHIINTHGEKGATIKFSVSVEPDPEMGLRARVGSSFTGSSLKRTWKAQLREDKEGDKQLELFTA